MNPLSLLECVPGITCDQEGDSHDVVHIVLDSRKVEQGDIFAALIGVQSDAHDYLEQVYARGCKCVLVSTPVRAPSDVTVLRVTDVREMLGFIASALYGYPTQDLVVIGITGTNGKTTCAALVEQILSTQGIRVGVFGTLNTRWPGHEIPTVNTTPESSVLQQTMRAMRDDGVTHVVMEVSSHGLATHRLNGTLFDIAVFTNLSQDHLDFHGTMRAYEESKFTLFTDHLERARAAGKMPVAVINSDDEAGERLAKLLQHKSSARLQTFGQNDWPGEHVRASSIVYLEDGTQIGLDIGDVHLQGETRLMGEFNVENVLAATLASEACGFEFASLVRGWPALQPPRGRMQAVVPGVFVDYAHTPDALERALETLRPVCRGRLMVVFGCGGERDKGKRRLMGEVANRLADVVILTSDNPRNEDPDAIIQDIALGCEGLENLVDFQKDRGLVSVVERSDAIELAVRNKQPDDLVLIAGKGHETYQEIGGKRRHFDDVEEVLRVEKTWVK